MERYVESAGARIWACRYGEGTPVLLLNGRGGSDYLAPVSEMIQHRRSVIRFEPRCCGRSDRDGRYDLATLVNDMESIRASYGVERWVLLGHSAGPNHALAYAMYRPDAVDGIDGVAGGNFLNDRDWHTAYDAGLGAGGDESGDLDFDSDPEVLTQGNREWKAFIKSPDLMRRLADLSTPCALLGASQDIRPNWPIQQLAELLPKGRYREIQGAGHYPWLTHYDATSSAVNEALDYVESINASLTDPGSRSRGPG